MRPHTFFARFRSALLVLAVLGLLVACGDDDTDTSTGSSTSETTTTTATSEPTDSSTTTPAQSTVRAYFMRDELVGPVGRQASGAETARAAMEALLAGPTAAEQEIGFVTAIPDGTELLGLTIADGTATVDLSAPFESGGGSLSMMSRVAQVVFTLTQFPTVDDVAFELAGEPVTTFSGEGLLLDSPQTRDDWEQMSPAILVESPLPLTEVSSPLEVSGTANTFEAVFQLNVVDGDGLIVYDEPVMATSGTGTRGTFDVTAEFDVPTAGVGAVIVFEYSPKDGSQENIVEVPVRIR